MWACLCSALTNALVCERYSRIAPASPRPGRYLTKLLLRLMQKCFFGFFMHEPPPPGPKFDAILPFCPPWDACHSGPQSRPLIPDLRRLQGSLGLRLIRHGAVPQQWLTPFSGQLVYFIVVSSSTYEMLSHVVIAINRFTVIALDNKHSKVRGSISVKSQGP